MLDLAVNSNSERGLLGIALDQNFKLNGTVYLYWSETHDRRRHTAGDAVPLLGNRLDRFHWDGTTLDVREDAAPQPRVPGGRTDRTSPAVRFRGNHNGGVLRVGPDGKLYLIVGDTGRRGQTQNLFDGPVRRGHRRTTSSAARTPTTSTSPA